MSAPPPRRPPEKSAATPAARGGAELPVVGPAAPPRANGELVFAEPWESRLFGITLALIEDGVFTWPEFQEELIAAIRVWETLAEPGVEYRYYERWQAALEGLLGHTDLCPEAELEARARTLAARPHGHDH